MAPLPPTFVSPSEGSTTEDATPTLDWGSVSGAWKYQAYVREDGFPWLDSRTSPETTSSQWTVSPALGYKAWGWQVRVRDIAGNWGSYGRNGVAGNWGHFTTAPAPNAKPDKPNARFPSDGASSVGLTPRLYSSGFSDSDSQDTHAATRWQLATSGGFSSGSLVWDHTDTDSSKTSEAVPSGTLSYSSTYYWRMRHRDSRGKWSDWSDYRDFTTVAAPETKPDLAIHGVSYAAGSYSSDGDPLSITVIEVNLPGGGDVPVSSAYDLEVRLSLDTVWGNADDVVLHTQAVDGGLSAGGTRSYNWGAVIPEGTAVGDYYLGVQVDGGGVVEESNDDNNVWWSSARGIHIDLPEPTTRTGTIDGWRASGQYGWSYGFDVSLIENTEVLIVLNIQLDGDDPGQTLRTQWENGIETIWSHKYDIVDGDTRLPIVVDCRFVSTDGDYVVDVHNGTGRTNILNWYTDHPAGWENSYHDEIAAHEAGHMIGLYDEYSGGATDPVTGFVDDNSIMGQNLSGVHERYFEEILDWVEETTGRDADLVRARPSAPSAPPPGPFGEIEDMPFDTNHAPTLTSLATLQGARKNEEFSVRYEDLLAASDAGDVDGDTIWFRIESVGAGTLTKDGVSVIAGWTLLAQGESLVWHPPTDVQGTLDAFTVTAWDGSLTSGRAVNARIDVVSSTSLQAFVTRFYVECLGRQPDPDGLNNWVDYLVAGTRTGADVAFGFMFSQEYLLRFRTDSEFVDDSYHAFFDREPDADGKANWLGDLERGVSRQSVLNGFVYSLEFVNLSNRFGTIPYTEAQQQRYTVRLFIRRFYVEVLEREADEPGLTYWADGLIDGSLVGSQLAWNFTFSPEYLLRNRTNSEFVDDSYHAFFNRDPDAPGKANWLAALAGGASRVDVLKGFTDSLEFANLCGLYDILPNLA